MGITPSSYTAFITTVDTTASAVWTQLDADETEGRWVTDHPMQGGSQITFGWTGLMPKARPWFGSRVLFEPAGQTYTVIPIPYELTYTIDRFTLEDSDANTMSIFWRMLPDMARQWRRQKCYEVRDLLENSGIQTGTRQNGWDALTYFNTAHPIDFYNSALNPGGMFTSGTYANDFIGGQSITNGGVTTTVGGALTVLGFSSLLQYMCMIPGEDGEVLGVRPDVMMVPSTLQVEAMFILRSTMLAPPVYGNWSASATQVGAQDNMLARLGVEPVVNPFLKKTTRWYLFDTKRAFRPVLWVVREAPRTVPRVNENDPLVWDQHRYAWGGWDRVTPAWGPSFLGARSGPTGA
jgi:phage major head subunit gpT-like protein